MILSLLLSGIYIGIRTYKLITENNSNTIVTIEDNFKEVKTPEGTVRQHIRTEKEINILEQLKEGDNYGNVKPRDAGNLT